MTALLVFAAVGLGTYGARSVFILATGDRPLPPALERALPFLGPAVLAALASSLLTADSGAVDFLTNGAEVAAVIVAILVAWRFHSFIYSFVAAMATLWILQALL